VTDAPEEGDASATRTFSGCRTTPSSPETEQAIANSDWDTWQSFLDAPSWVTDDVSTSSWSRRMLMGGHGMNSTPSREAKGSPVLWK
jgi:hypothetical protein